MVERLRIAALLSEVTGLHLQFSFMNKIIDLKSTAEELLKTQFKTPAVTLGTAKEHPWLPKMYESFGFKAYDKVHFRGKQHTTVLFKKDLI